MEKRGVERQDTNESLQLEPSTAAGRMLRAVASAASDGAHSTAEVDAAAKALVTELRLANEPPEQVLVQIKQILAAAGLKPSHGPADATHIIGRQVGLYRTVIESSIRYYFTTGDDPTPAST
jgi:hypothetical protein